MSETEEHNTNSIIRDGADIIIRMPASEAHELCVALAPCPCRAAKSNGTTAIRERLRRGLKRMVASKWK